MTKASALRIFVPLLIVCCASLFCIAELANAQTTCPAGSQAATASDLATMTADGITNPQIGQCWTPANFGGSAGAQAKQYLQSDVCPGDTIDTADLNPGFAVCAQKFVQSAKAQDSNFCITSAYRSPAQQLAACMKICAQSSCPGLCAPPGASFHQYGLAIDVQTSIPLPTLWNLEQAQGIINPTGLHSSDPYHVQSPSRSTPICNSGNISPSNIAISPGQAIAAAVQGATGLPINACTAQNYCSGTMIMSQSASCTVTAIQACQYGCSNGVCLQQQSVAPTAAAPAAAAATPATGATTATTPATTGSTVTATTPTGSSGTTIVAPTLATNNGTSTLDLLEELADETPTSGIPSTNTPIVLNAADSEIAQLEANAPPGVTYAEPTSAYFPGSGSSNAQSQTSVTNTNTNSNTNSNITTTQAQGYEIGATGSDYTITNGSGYGGSGSDSGTQPQAGVETFGQTAPADTSGPTPLYGNPNTFGLIGFLDTLKAQVQGAVAFLSIYGQPFQGNIPSQNVGE